MNPCSRKAVADLDTAADHICCPLQCVGLHFGHSPHLHVLDTLTCWQRIARTDAVSGQAAGGVVKRSSPGLGFQSHQTERAPATRDPRVHFKTIHYINPFDRNGSRSAGVVHVLTDTAFKSDLHAMQPVQRHLLTTTEHVVRQYRSQHDRPDSITMGCQGVNAEAPHPRLQPYVFARCVVCWLVVICARQVIVWPRSACVCVCAST